MNKNFVLDKIHKFEQYRLANFPSLDNTYSIALNEILKDMANILERDKIKKHVIKKPDLFQKIC